MDLFVVNCISFVNFQSVLFVVYLIALCQQCYRFKAYKILFLFFIIPNFDHSLFEKWFFLFVQVFLVSCHHHFLGYYLNSYDFYFS